MASNRTEQLMTYFPLGLKASIHLVADSRGVSLSTAVVQLSIEAAETLGFSADPTVKATVYKGGRGGRPAVTRPRENLYKEEIQLLDIEDLI